jgi:hypothetical protein
MIYQDIIGDFRSLPDHHTHAMVNKEASANLRAGVDFNTGQKTAQVGNQPSRPAPAATPEPMRQPMPQHGMQPGITENRLKPGRPRGVTRANTAADFKRFLITAEPSCEPWRDGQAAFAQKFRIEQLGLIAGTTIT